MNHGDTAVGLFDSGYNCSESIFCAFSGEYGVDSDTAARISGGFGGGMGRCGEVCGVLTGSFMTIGLAFMKGDMPPSPEMKADVYARVSEMARRFREVHGEIRCNDLLGVDISTPEGQKKAKDGDFHHTKCAEFVRTAAGILEDMLEG